MEEEKPTESGQEEKKEDLWETFLKWLTEKTKEKEKKVAEVL